MNQYPSLAATAWRPLKLAFLTGLVSTCIVACGGGDSAAENERANAGAETFSPLLADDGTSMPSMPDTVPADAAARTQTGRYASSRQAEQLERALGDDVIRVNVECCGVEGVDQAIAIAYGVQAAANLPSSAPILVRSADLRLGALATNRLTGAGYGNVWLVTR
ncbi:MAG: hypothetical protein H7Z19_07405 [Chitinophagaceae bacterium]|nr:hypothetical protein [Rubrivivax sp.]